MNNLYQFRFTAMGGQNEIRLYGESQEAAQLVAQKAIDEVCRIESRYSRYLPNSLISSINSNAGVASVQIDAEAVHLFQVADYWNQTSDGLFDITSGVLSQLWNAQLVRIPTEYEISQRLQTMGWKKVQFSNNQIYLPLPGMEIDLGGIAKEYAVDRAAQFLIDQDVFCGLINLGGDLRVLGPHPDGSAWPIQVAHPRMPGTFLATINVAKGAVATSGDYIRFIDIGGKRYSHILNPKSGQPVDYWQSVTTLAPLCLTAGHSATLAMLLEHRAQSMLNQAQLQYLLVGPKGEIIQNLG